MFAADCVELATGVPLGETCRCCSGKREAMAKWERVRGDMVRYGELPVSVLLREMHRR